MPLTPEHRTPDLVVFDFDGCLVDSITLAAKAHHDSLGSKGITLAVEEIASCVRSSYDETIATIIAKHPELSATLIGSPIAQQIRADNTKRLERSPDAPVFPIVPYLLEALRASSTRLAIFSSSRHDRIDRHLRTNKLDSFFDQDMILAADDLEATHRKPSGLALRELAGRLRLPSTAFSLYIGHDSADLLAAADADMLYLSSEWSSYTHYEPHESPIPVRSLLDLWALGIIANVHPVVAQVAKLVESGRLVPFVGAGFSLDSGFDDWAGLVQQVVGPGIRVRVGSLPELVAAYVRKHHALGEMRLRETVEEALRPKGGPRPKHFQLAALGANRIWTTNFDSLIEDAGNYQVVAEDSEVTPPGERTQLVKLHGSVVSRAAELVLTKRDFDFLFSEKTELLDELLSDAANRTLLFLGVSFDDPLSKHLLSRLDAKRRKRFRVPTHYTLRKENPEDQELVEVLKDHGIQTVPLPSWDSVEEVLIELAWNRRPRNAVISGALRGIEPTAGQIEFMQFLGSDLAAAGFNILVGNGPGVASHVVRGAKAWLDAHVALDAHRSRIRRYNRELGLDDFFDASGAPVAAAKERIERLIMPVGSFEFVTRGRSDPYDPLRKEMFRNANICIALGGAENSRGMRYEEDLTTNQGVPYLPLPQAGGFGRQEYDRFSQSDFGVYEHTGAVPLIRELLDEPSPRLASRLATASAILLVTRWKPSQA